WAGSAGNGSPDAGPRRASGVVRGAPSPQKGWPQWKQFLAVFGLISPQLGQSRRERSFLPRFLSPLPRKPAPQNTRTRPTTADRAAAPYRRAASDWRGGAAWLMPSCAAASRAAVSLVTQTT